jgi:elongation factor P
MADTSDFRNGFTMEWNGDIWSIIEFQHVKPGKGGAFVRTKLRNVRTGRVLDNTFRAGERVDQVRVERRKYQFLYEDDLGLHFMNTDTYEQINLPVDAVAGRQYVKEGATIDILIHAETEQPLTTEIPGSVDLKVVETEPGLKGDTATGATKPAKVESGATVYVPLFVNEGDVIRVNTERGDYVTRVNTA